MFRASTLLLALALGAVASAGQYWISGAIDGSQENPPTSTKASGSLWGTYNSVTNELMLDITVTGLESALTGRHIHRGAVGVNGPVVYHLMGAIGGTSYSSASLDMFTITEADEAELLSGLWYVNFHTRGIPSGEVRGQLKAEPVPEPATMGALAAGLFVAIRKRRQSR
jgi:hypothetical protein